MKWVFYKYYHRLLPITLGLLALAIPLLRDFHLESALLAACVGCLWAGWKASNRSKETSDLHLSISILGYLYLFGLPLLIYTILAGCFSIHGLGLWILYPLPSVFFGVAIGRLLRIWQVPFGRLLTVLTLLGISIGGLIIEFYSFPQVYFFNHVWGGWPGPIYDETVRVTASLAYFRIMTLLWICLLWSLPYVRTSGRAKWIFVGAAALLAFFYTRLPEMGIISPEAYIQEQLGGVQQTDHFTIYFDENFYTTDEIGLIAKEHEFYFKQITEALQLQTEDGDWEIESYLYAHPWQKKKLTGAKFTSYVPVWLEQDQLHIAKQQLDSSLKHEMVHVLAKGFGNTLINASWSIGLIEGLAVAVAPDRSNISSIDQIVVSEKPLPDADQMKHALSPLGFYGGRSTVNYTTAGSFVQYLLENHPVSNFKEAYRSSDLSQAYKEPFNELVKGWHAHLETISVDSADQRVARRLFSIPSLFEKECPHILSDFAAHWDDYRYYLAKSDSLRALKSLEEAFLLKQDNLFLKAEWAFQNLKQGYHGAIQKEATKADTLVDLQLLYADAFKLTGNTTEAKKYLDRGAELFNDDPEPDSLQKVALETRLDPLQWEYYLGHRYENRLFDEEIFKDLIYRTKVLMIAKAMDSEQWSKFTQYSRLLYDFPADKRYFDNYLGMIHLLGYLQEWELAEKWLTKLDAPDLRQRYKERLQQQRDWITFLRQKNGMDRYESE